MLSEEQRRRASALVHERCRPRQLGRVKRVTPLTVEIWLTDGRIGEIVSISGSAGSVPCEIVDVSLDKVIAVPLRTSDGVSVGNTVDAAPDQACFPVGSGLFGRTVDAFGVPLDGRGPILGTHSISVDAASRPLRERSEVVTRFDTGVRVIDGLLTCGRGQRVGLFAGAGVGKSVLVRQIASQSAADVFVIGLVGERTREVVETAAWAQQRGAIVVAATSDRSPMERVRCAKTATAIAEDFAGKGATVLLLIDSLTRFAMALREVGLALGEAPATKGYPPRVFAEMPRLLERVAPLVSGGSVTGFYTVLVEGDDLSDPVADSARSLLDAHIILSRDLATRGFFPAVDVIASASRVAGAVTTPAVRQQVTAAREVLARRQTIMDLISLGAYVRGQNPEQDRVLAVAERLDAWARQAPDERADYAATLRGLQGALEGGPR